MGGEVGGAPGAFSFLERIDFETLHPAWTAEE